VVVFKHKKPAAPSAPRIISPVSRRRALLFSSALAEPVTSAATLLGLVAMAPPVQVP